MVRGHAVRSWPFDQLLKQPVVNDTLAGRPLLVTFDTRSYCATVWSRIVDGHELSFEAAGDEIRDVQTRSLWDSIRGDAVDGPLKGQKLRQLPAIVSFRIAWLKLHPETQLWSADLPSVP